MDSNKISIFSKIFGFLKRYRLFFIFSILLVCLTAILYIFLNNSQRSNAAYLSKVEKDGKGRVFASRLKIPSSFDTKLQNGPYTCPLDSSLCQKKEAYKNGFLNMKFKSNTSLRALFDGDVIDFESEYQGKNDSKKKFRLVIITSLERGLQAMYYFKGETGDIKDIKEGEILGKSNGELIDFMESSFVLKVIKIGTESGRFATLGPKDFKK